MEQVLKTLEFDKILETLQEYALTKTAKEELGNLRPFLSERELKHRLRETTEARTILENKGAVPLFSLNDTGELLMIAEKGGCLTPEQLETVERVLVGVKRLKNFLNSCKELNLSLPYYEEELKELEDLRKEIADKIRGGRVDDHASKRLKDLRSDLEKLDNRMRMKADAILKGKKDCFSDSFVTTRNGRLCLPVKKDCKFKISGSIVDKSSTGATVFVEPTAVAQIYEELVNLKLEEEDEERRILYTLTAMVYEEQEAFQENIRLIEKLDGIFARGKLSMDMQGIEPEIILERRIEIVNGRHPFLNGETCVPLNFQIGGETTGVVITGPNTGGKTVAIKTVGLLNVMAQCGLHVPCERGTFTMNSHVLCDIGDGQDITQNLSTFSAHITNVLEILSKVNSETLVIMDELGSGTDPTEGMGIAIAIMEELRKSGCLFLTTTHYPEVKEYAKRAEGVMNARMSFDRESLKPLYRMEIGEAGESCAFYIAKELGMPNEMLTVASRAAYGRDSEEFLSEDGGNIKKERGPKIEKRKTAPVKKDLSNLYHVGDCVMIYPDKKLGIVCKPVNEKGVLQIQFKDTKIWLNQKRVKLHVKAETMYPEDYDFSIVFDSVAARKTRNRMDKGYLEEMMIEEK